MPDGSLAVIWITCSELFARPYVLHSVVYGESETAAINTSLMKNWTSCTSSLSIANPDIVTVSLTVCDDSGVSIDRTGGVTSFSGESSLFTVTAIEGMSVEFPS